MTTWIPDGMSNSKFQYPSRLAQWAGPAMQLFGVVGSAFGSYYQAKSAKSNLEFQSRMAERTAQSIMAAGQDRIKNLTYQAGKVKSAQRVSQAARGIVHGEGSAAEEAATTELMMQEDVWTINANTIREAANARIRGTMLAGAAEGISPGLAGATSLLEGTSQVAPSWYKMMRQTPGDYDRGF